MTHSNRPKHVVILDADNPMEEIRGEFFWREDHESILVEQTRRVYECGFNDGVAAANRAAMNVAVRPRRIRRRLRVYAFGLVMAALALYVAAHWHG